MTLREPFPDYKRHNIKLASSNPAGWWELQRERVMANDFAKADTGKTGKIHFMQIFEANNCTLEEEDLEKISELEDDSGEIIRDNY